MLLTCLFLLAGTSRCWAWTPAGPWGGVVHDLVTHPAYENTVYAATGNGIYRYEGALPWAEYPTTRGYRVLTSTLSPDLGSLFAAATTTRGPFNFSVLSPGGELYSLDLGSGAFTSEGVSEVTALTTCGAGDVLAGTSTGAVYRIAGDGSGPTLSLTIAGPISALAGQAGSGTVYMARGTGSSDILVSPNCGSVSASWTAEHSMSARITALGWDGSGGILAGTADGKVYTRSSGSWDATPYGTGLPPYPVIRFSFVPPGTTLAILRDHSWNFFSVNDGPAGLFEMPPAGTGPWTRWTRFDAVSSFISEVIPFSGDLLVAFDYAGIRRAAPGDGSYGSPADWGIAAVPLQRIIFDPLSEDRALAVGPGGVYERQSGMWRHHVITTPAAIPSDTLQWIRETGFLSAAFSPDGKEFWVGGDGTGLMRAAPVASGASTLDWYQIYFAYLRNVIKDIVPDPYNGERLWWATSSGIHFTSRANTTTPLTSGEVRDTQALGNFISHDLDLEIVTEGVYNMVASAVPNGYGFTRGLLSSQFVDDGTSTSQSWAGALYASYTLRSSRFLPTGPQGGITRVLAGADMNNSLGMVARENGSWEIDPGVPGPIGLPHNPHSYSLDVAQGEDGDGFMDAFAVVGNGTVSPGVYHSSGALPGAQWTEITGDLALYRTRPTCIAIDPRDGNLLWVTTDRASAFTLRGTHCLDNMPPGFPAGSSFDAVGSTATEIFFMWAAPGDDGSLPGWAERYELRCGETPLVAAGDFPIWGTQLTCDPPRMAQTVEVHALDVPSLGFAAGTIFCALRALDEQGQASPVFSTGPLVPLAREPVAAVSHQAGSGGVTISWSLGSLSTDPYFLGFGEIVVEKQVGGEWSVSDRLAPTTTQWQDSWVPGTYSPGESLTYRLTAVDGVDSGVPVVQLVTIPEPQSGGGGGGGGGGCFIATAAYGSADEKAVLVLRQYRDRFLMKSDWGQSLVRLYYAASPPLAKMIGRCPVLKGFTRLLLKPVQAAAAGPYKGTWFPAGLAVLIILSTLISALVLLGLLVLAVLSRAPNPDDLGSRLETNRGKMEY